MMSSSPEQGAFRALADPTRRQILMHLGTSDMTIAEVADHFDMTRGAVRKHLAILEEGKLISVHPKGRERINRLEPDGLKSAAAWLAHFGRFWDAKLAGLRSAIDHQQTTESENNNG